MNFNFPLWNSGQYTGLQLSVVPFTHLSFCLSLLFCSLHKAIYITSASPGLCKVRFSDSSSICYLFFLSMQSILQFFVIGFSTTVPDRRLILSKLTMTCCIVGLRTGILLFILPCICSFFFSPHFFSKISPQLYKIESSYLAYRITNYKLHRGIDKQLCPVCSSLYFYLFLSLHAFNTVIFRNRFLSNFSR